MRPTRVTSPPELRRRLRSAAARRLLALALVALPVAAQETATAPVRPIRVSYLSEHAVYVDAGRAEGLAVGSRLRVVRSGDAVADLEVDYVAEHSASCRVVTLMQAIRTGDGVLLLSPPVAPDEGTETAPPPAPGEPEIPSPAPLASRLEPPAPAFRASGYLSFGYHDLATTDGIGSSESTGRVSLRLRNLARQPLELRLRARSRSITRTGVSSSLPADDRLDRLYELSLAYLPPEGRVRLYLGRIGYGPFLAFGDVDGALAEVRVAGGFWLGALAGARPDLAELGYATAGRKYGAFLHYLHDAAAGDRYAELVLGGVTEKADGGEASRDYLTVESRFGSGARWWLSQRAELDLNRGWRREESGKSTELSNAALAAAVQLSPSLRASISYDQRRNVLTWETRPLPEEVFTRYFRQGARVGLDWNRRSGWNGAIGAGSERADDGSDPTTSYFGSLFHARSFGQPLLLGADASYYSGGTAQGYVASLRGRWAFRGGHDVGLTVGGSRTQLAGIFGGSSRDNRWARLSGDVQLPGRLWLYLEVELDQGDDFDGHRALAELGYRF